VTSKLQITLPKVIADRYGISPGDHIDWAVAGDTIRVIPARSQRPPSTVAARLRLFDRATEREASREGGRRVGPAVRSRGWTREQLYDRGRSR
jgi:bifunctional DNA-binding transcriptional regulator/antitoxin component of YhaV-PrlF toxin-antitoxin module